jgi:hypothetical protein
MSPGFLHPVLGYIQEPQVVQQKGHIKCVGGRILLRQLTVNLQCLLARATPETDVVPLHAIRKSDRLPWNRR